MEISCTLGSIEQVLLINASINEFSKETTAAKLIERLSNKQSLILVACVDGQLAGYKIGYELTDRQFYSWLGAVDPTYRRLGVATALLRHQEHWVIKQGFNSIRVKSMNRFPSMLNMLISNGYHIDGYEDNGDAYISKIRFIKKL